MVCGTNDRAMTDSLENANFVTWQANFDIGTFGITHIDLAIYSMYLLWQSLLFYNVAGWNTGLLRHGVSGLTVAMPTKYATAFVVLVCTMVTLSVFGDPCVTFTHMIQGRFTVRQCFDGPRRENRPVYHHKNQMITESCTYLAELTVASFARTQHQRKWRGRADVRFAPSRWETSIQALT